jgi:hypothetical protein
LNRAGGRLDGEYVSNSVVGIGRLIACLIDHLDQPTEIVVDKTLTCLAGERRRKACDDDYYNGE